MTWQKHLTIKNYLLSLNLLMFVGALSLAAAFEFAGAAAMGAMAGALAVLFVFAGQKSRETSHFYLTEAKLGIDEASRILQDNSYDRAKWVLAARMIRRASLLSRNITEDEHRLAFELWTDLYKNKFHEILLSDKDVEFSPRFFAGAESWEDALQKQWDSGQRLIHIPEVILKNIYDFAKYPDDYVDPIERCGELTEDDLFKMDFTMKALVGYIRKMREEDFNMKRIGAQFRRSE